jgi:Lipocalin-like domain
MTQTAEAHTPDHIAGTWRVISAQIQTGAENVPAYGSKPSGLLVFTEDMHYVEVLTDGSVPKFASSLPSHGTPEANQEAMAGSIGMFGTYTAHHNGNSAATAWRDLPFPTGEATFEPARTCKLSWRDFG